MFVASNMMLLIVHIKMMAAPLVLELQTAAVELHNLGDEIMNDGNEKKERKGKERKGKESLTFDKLSGFSNQFPGVG